MTPPTSPTPGLHPGCLPFNFGTFLLSFIPQDPLPVPKYAGSMFRGAFGWALQRVVCVTHTYDCPPCFLKDRCLFPYVFDTAPPAATQIMRKYRTAPHPFILDPPSVEARFLPPGKPFSLGLTLFGKSLHSLPYFIFAFERLGRNGLGRHRVRCPLSNVTTTCLGKEWLLYSSDEGTLQPGDVFEQNFVLDLSTPSLSDNGSTPTQICLEFLTPFRVVFQEKLVQELAFHIFIRSLLRRLAHLSYFHCGGNTEGVPFREWIELAQQVHTASNDLHWYDWERYSSRQDTHMRLGGLVGTITFEGPLAPFLPLLQMGEVTHVGKGTSFGLGHYRLRTSDS